MFLMQNVGSMGQINRGVSIIFQLNFQQSRVFLSAELKKIENVNFRIVNNRINRPLWLVTWWWSSWWFHFFAILFDVIHLLQSHLNVNHLVAPRDIETMTAPIPEKKCTLVRSVRSRKSIRRYIFAKPQCIKRWSIK